MDAQLYPQVGRMNLYDAPVAENRAKQIGL